MSRISEADLPDELPVDNALVRVTFNNPEMHRGFASLSGRVHSASHLESRDRELVVLRIVGLLSSEFQLEQHTRAAAAAGLTEIEIEAAKTGQVEALSDGEAALVRFAEAVENASMDDDVWAEARRHYDELELMDTAMLAGFYGMAARFVLAMDIRPDVDPGVTQR